MRLLLEAVVRIRAFEPLIRAALDLEHGIGIEYVEQIGIDRHGVPAGNLEALLGPQIDRVDVVETVVVRLADEHAL